jgi:peptidyl-tRNA hydrolase
MEPQDDTAATTDRVVVMPLVVRVEKEQSPGRTDALEAAAIASLRVWRETVAHALPPTALLESWLEQPRKIVRRARASAWARVAAIAPISVQVRSAEVIGFPLTPIDLIPRVLARLPVTGTDLEDPEPPGPAPEAAAVLWLNPALIMSAGKAMAQAGHGALTLWDSLDGESRRTWTESGLPIAVRTASPHRWDQLVASGLPSVRDAGHTELAAGSMTVVVEPPRARRGEGNAGLPAADRESPNSPVSR